MKNCAKSWLSLYKNVSISPYIFLFLIQLTFYDYIGPYLVQFFNNLKKMLIYLIFATHVTDKDIFRENS